MARGDRYGWPSNKELERFNKRKKNISKAISQALENYDPQPDHGRISRHRRVGPTYPKIEVDVGQLIVKYDNTNTLSVYVCVRNTITRKKEFVKIPDDLLAPGRIMKGDTIHVNQELGTERVLNKDVQNYITYIFEVKKWVIQDVIIKKHARGQLDINNFIKLKFKRDEIGQSNVRNVDPLSVLEVYSEFARNPFADLVEPKNIAGEKCSNTEEKKKDLKHAEELKRKLDL